MKISTLFYTIKQGFVNIFRNKWYSLASIATIAACLFLFGLFYSVVANFRSIVMKAEEGVSVTVFFHSEWDQCEKLGTFLLISIEGTSIIRWANATFSYTFLSFSSRKSWNTTPRFRLNLGTCLCFSFARSLPIT